MNVKGKKGVRGFTIIEAVVILVIVAIFVTYSWTLFHDTVFLQSSVPRQNMVRAKDLNQVMENIRADYNYKPYPVWKPNHNYSVGDTVIPTVLSPQGQRFWYQCTQATEISGSSEPDPWTTVTVSDGATGNLIWTYQGGLNLMTLSALSAYVGVVDTVNKKCASNPIPPEKCYDKSTNQYGYYVTENKWIDFDPVTKTEINSSNQNILKVTISAKDDTGKTVAVVTALFF
jgi:type II secretory pathway pseudopilin PulG